MHKSWWFSKYKLYDKPFKAACSGIYSESLDGMPLILILVQNDSTTPPPANFCLNLKNTSPYLKWLLPNCK